MRRPSLLLLFLVFSGCGLFSLRDPESPDPGIQEHINNDPDSVKANFQLAVRNKSSGIDVFTNTLGETFTFKLDQGDAQRLYSRPDVSLTRNETITGWRVFVASIKSEQDLEIEFGNPEHTTTFGSDSVFYDQLPYRLIRRSGTAKDTLAAAAIDLFMSQKDGRWSILRWEDKIAPGPYPSLGARIETGSGHPR